MASTRSACSSYGATWHYRSVSGSGSARNQYDWHIKKRQRRVVAGLSMTARIEMSRERRKGGINQCSGMAHIISVAAAVASKRGDGENNRHGRSGV